MGEGGPLRHHLTTAHEDPEEHEVLKPPVSHQVVNLHTSTRLMCTCVSSLEEQALQSIACKKACTCSTWHNSNNKQGQHGSGASQWLA